MSPELVASIRLGGFAAALLAMGLWESAAPRRGWNGRRALRWPRHLALAALNTAALRLVPFLAATAAATYAESRGWGLLRATSLGPAAELLPAIVLLDLAIYLQHVAMHAHPLLWRLHAVHHADLDFDVTTGVRFHPLEMLLSAAWKGAAVAALGPSVAAVVAFETLLSVASLFSHGNVRLPRRLDRLVRSLLVTPDMHRVHHSVLPRETNRNFGFCLSCWDRLFRTYQAEPLGGHVAMGIGLPERRGEAETAPLRAILAQPFLPAPAVRDPARRDGSSAAASDFHEL